MALGQLIDTVLNNIFRQYYGGLGPETINEKPINFFMTEVPIIYKPAK